MTELTETNDTSQGSLIRLVDLRQGTGDFVIPRAAIDVSTAMPIAAELINDVQSRGEAALLDQAERFDRVRPAHIRVPQEEIDRATTTLSGTLLQAIEESIARVWEASTRQVPKDTLTAFSGGQIIQRWQPVKRVGLYVPGGKAVYPSSVIMNVIAAQAAGVKEIALATPPQEAFGGKAHPTVLSVAALLGVSEIYLMGGAGAVGALADGVAEIGLKPVDAISGPGNVFVAAAKRVVSDRVKIDSEAGPTEILIIADASANAQFVAADMLSQAEHDELAASVLVTTSQSFASSVQAELSDQLDRAVNKERAAASLAGNQSIIILVDSLQQAAELSNNYAPEHLSVQVQNNSSLLPSLTDAGAIFVGPYTPVSLGDYMAGSNHVLPTGGKARYSSGLGAYTFLRPQQVVEYQFEGLAEIAELVQEFANSEHLNAHAEAIRVRTGADRLQEG